MPTSKVLGAVGTELKPPLVVVMGMGKGTEGPRETVGALWSLLTIISVKLSICNIGANIAVIFSGPTVDGAMYCAVDDACNTEWLRFQFYSIRTQGIMMSIFMLLLELGVPIVVRIAGTMERGAWYNNYPVRGLVFIFVGSITLPDRNWVWYANLISGTAFFDLYFGSSLLFVPVVNFILSFLPRGYPTCVRTQRPESTFWATVTLLTTNLVALCFGVALYEIFSTDTTTGSNVFASSFSTEISEDDNFVYKNTEKSYFVYQQYCLILAVTFLLPILFFAELEVTPILHCVPEFRYLITKGPIYLLLSGVLLISDGKYPGYFVITYTAISSFVLGLLYLGFPAVRMVHEIAGDDLSPKTRFYPGLYTFFSVWGVILAMLTIVLISWQGALYETSSMAFTAKYQYWSNKVLALILTILTICVELELRIVFDVTVGGVPIGFNILRTWIIRSLLYVFVACLIADGEIDETFYSLRDIGTALVWSWIIYAIVYFVFYVHLVSSAMLYRWYLANERWVKKSIIGDAVVEYNRENIEEAADAEESTRLLSIPNEQQRDTGDDTGNLFFTGENSLLQAFAIPSLFAKERQDFAAAHSDIRGKQVARRLQIREQAKKANAVKRFVLQPNAHIMIRPLAYTERNANGTLSDYLQDEEPVDHHIQSKRSSSFSNENELSTTHRSIYVRCLLGQESHGISQLAHVEVWRNVGSRMPFAIKGAQRRREKIAKWEGMTHVSLPVSVAISQMGREAAIQVQVWSMTASSFPSGASRFLPDQSQLGNGCKTSDMSGNSIDICLGEARVALDHLTLGVSGKIQLHMPGTPQVLRGTLEVVITYEPPMGLTTSQISPTPINTDLSANISQSRDHSHKSSTPPNVKKLEIRPGKNVRQQSPRTSRDGTRMVRPLQSELTNGSENAVSHGTYESAIDPTSGRKYFFNRKTGHRTWHRPDPGKPAALDPLESANL